MYAESDIVLGAARHTSRERTTFQLSSDTAEHYEGLEAVQEKRTPDHSRAINT